MCGFETGGVRYRTRVMGFERPAAKLDGLKGGALWLASPLRFQSQGLRCTNSSQEMPTGLEPKWCLISNEEGK